MDEKNAKNIEELADIRQDYDRDVLHRRDLDTSPTVQLQRWLDDAITANVEEPTAMTLATTSRDGVPSARIVLLKGLDADGLRFFTNYESRKAREMAENPRASLCLFWVALHRQVRVDGTIEKLPRDASAAYYHSRPRGSQLGAWASPQSVPIASREALEDRLRAVEKRFQNDDPVPLPDFWGGYLLRPTEVEFWQGRPSRLHDRFRYSRDGQDRWRVERLAP